MSSAAALQLPSRRPQPGSVPPPPSGPPRPALRLIEGGRAPARVTRQAMYRRRRLVALVVVASVTAAALLLASAVLARTAGDGTPHPVAGTVESTVHVVQPGETLWSIARGLDPDGDVRLVVDRLIDRNGHAPLVVGQRLEVG